MDVRVTGWDQDIGEAAGRPAEDALAQADIIIDGIAGTGTVGALRGSAAEIVQAINDIRDGRKIRPLMSGGEPPFVLSVDVPSGNCDEWKQGMLIVKADATVCVEPQKYCVYNPAARACAGDVIPVKGIFPQKLIDIQEGADLWNWDSARKLLPPVPPSSYKQERGRVEIRAGAAGTSGAALIAARGAQAAGAGLVSLVVDDEIFPIIASRVAGIMASPLSHVEKSGGGGFDCDALLLGPGWGKAPDRKAVFDNALKAEAAGTPLILDADALPMASGAIFNGNAILTPHPGEFASYLGLTVADVLSDPASLALKTAKAVRATVILKGHVVIIADPDGRWGVVDGMAPVLASGGSGDLLAGICAALAARVKRETGALDGYACACAAASLLMAAGRAPELSSRFTDPLEIADKIAAIAGAAWLAPGAGGTDRRNA
jgi:NAD(P)H-hydrate epimerase